MTGKSNLCKYSQTTESCKKTRIHTTLKKVHRLQGSDFEENYNSTPQIQVANIPWHYKGMFQGLGERNMHD